MTETKISIMITLRERDMLLNETTAIGEDILSKIRIAEVVGDKIRFSISADDLDHLLDNMAFEANHPDREKKEAAFDRLYDSLENELDRHDLLEETRNPPQSEGLIATHRSEMDEDLVQLMDEDFVHLINQEIFGFTPRPISAYFDEPIQVLGGLKPKQIQALFRDGWWEEESLIRLNADLVLADFAASRFLNNARIFLQFLQEVGGATLTVKGNLARKYVAQMLERMEMKSGHKEEIYRYNRVVNEMDFWPLHVLRLVCSMAKLVRKYKKRLVVTKLGLSLLAEEKAGQLCASLFDAHFTEFNLAYLDHLPDELHIVQEFFPYSLYRLTLLDVDREYPIADLPEVLFPPSLVNDLDAINEYLEAESYIQCRFLRPLEKFGLVSLRVTKEPGDLMEMDRYVRKTALFERFVKTT